jgi:hypothetical protein
MAEVVVCGGVVGRQSGEIDCSQPLRRRLGAAAISHAAPVERRTIQMHASFAQQHNIFYTDLMLSKADNLDAQGFTDVEHDSEPAHPKTRLPHPSTLQYQF